MRAEKLLVALVLAGLLSLTAACGTSAARAPQSSVPASHQSSPTLSRVAKFVSFIPVLPAELPAGYAFRSVQVDRPPVATSHAKQLTALILTFVGHGNRFQLTEMASHVTVVSAKPGPRVDGQPMYVATTVNNGVKVITAELRLSGVTYLLDSPGSLSLAEVEQVLASVAR
jgi:hypothetical protein